MCSLVPRPSAGGREGTRVYMYFPCLNYRNVGKIRHMHEQCVPGLPSPRGRPGNEASVHICDTM